ncbi:hypothetical protein F5146DRAFT_1007349 [Armillaria mellea]|nr:hypothetical protein F5146DRAFT_1007349 [Armillaria mellea]
MPPKPYICFCCPGGHKLLPGREKIAYLLDLKAKKQLQPQMSSPSASDHGSNLGNATSPSLESDIDRLTAMMAPLTLQGDTPEPVDELTARMAPLVLTDDGPEPITHADELMAHILTGGGPILVQQPSKLWSPSSQLEKPEDQVKLQDASGITFTDVQSTLLSASNEIRGSHTTPPSHCPPPNNPSTHPSNTRKTQGLTCPAASALHRRTLMGSAKVEQSINRIDTNAELLLQRMSALLLANLSSDKAATSRKHLTEIASELKNLRELLSCVKYRHEDAFKEQKVTIVEVFREIERRWTMANVILPQVEESLEPLLYSTAHHIAGCRLQLYRGTESHHVRHDYRDVSLNCAAHNGSELDGES